MRMCWVITVAVAVVAGCSKPAPETQGGAKGTEETAASSPQPGPSPVGGGGEDSTAPNPEPTDDPLPSPHTVDGEEAPGEGERPRGAQGQPCDDGQCDNGLECVEYYGIAGPRGPEFNSCEIRCGGKAPPCPDGQACVTIADGPGQVCRD